MAKAGICFIGLPAYASRIDLLEKKGRLHKILAGISSDCHLDKWSLHNRNGKIQIVCQKEILHSMIMSVNIQKSFIFENKRLASRGKNRYNVNKELHCTCFLIITVVTYGSPNFIVYGSKTPLYNFFLLP